MTDPVSISLSGTFKVPYNPSGVIRKSLTPTTTLVLGSQCNDGRPITESWRYNQALKLGCTIIGTDSSVNVSQPTKKKKPKLATVAAPIKEYIPPPKLLVDKYMPQSSGDIIGHKEQIATIRGWLQSWNDGYPTMRGILVNGPPGIGKTSSVHFIAKELGYHITEYNASDSRSVAVLRNLMALGIKRLRKEVIIMDEIDGISERGGVGELAGVIRKSTTPIICIANDKPLKLKPIINACLEVKFNRPNKSTVAGVLYKIAQKEGILITKDELESMCEHTGNDIRNILNSLEFYREATADDFGKKDGLLRVDPFSATQRLIGNKRISIDDAINMVFVDYGLVPLMVGECYVNASKNSLEDAVRASEFISVGDMMDKRIYQRQEWGLLPGYVTQVVSAAKTVSGPAPFQIFPQWLGKNSKRLKHKRWIETLAQKLHCPSITTRLDMINPIQNIVLGGECDVRRAVDMMESMGLTRDDLMDVIQEVCLEKIEIPTKIKTGITREFNKRHDAKKTVAKKGKRATVLDKKAKEDTSDVESDLDYDDADGLDADETNIMIDYME